MHYKLFTATNPYLPQLYTVGGEKLSINVLPETNLVPAGFKAGVPGIYNHHQGSFRYGQCRS